MCIENIFVILFYILLTLVNGTGRVYFFALHHMIVAWLVVVLFYRMFLHIIEWTITALDIQNNYMFMV